MERSVIRERRSRIALRSMRATRLNFMVAYPRNFVPGGTFFFTVVLENRRSSLLVDKIASLRLAFRVARAERPFKLDAIVILPDHLHAVMTLPDGDSDFSGRWRRIKTVFSRQVVAEAVPVSQN